MKIFRKRITIKITKKQTNKRSFYDYYISIIHNMSFECQCCCIETKQIVTCNCDYNVCKSCFKHYVLDNPMNPTCMNCNQSFTRKFLCEKTSISWVNGALKKKQDEILVEKELAKLPMYQTEAKRKKDLRAVMEELYKIQDEKRTFERKYRYITELMLKKADILYREISGRRLHEGSHSYAEEAIEFYANYFKSKDKASLSLEHRQDIDYHISYEYKNWLTMKRICQDINVKYTNIVEKKRELFSSIKKPKQQHFFMKCPVADCKGSLSTAYKCGMCDTNVCSKCHAIKPEGTAAAHECNPQDVESVQEIKKTTRNCPGCSAPTFKIEGCDQMFCTVPGCETAFSFRTGLKETGRIHNPHYFEMKNKGLLNRNPGDRPCGGLPEQTLHQMGRLLKDTGIGYCIRNMHRNSIHFDEVIIDKLRRETATQIDNKDIIIRYMLNDIDSKKFKMDVARRHKKQLISKEILDVCEIFSELLQEHLRILANTFKMISVPQNRTELTQLCTILKFEFDKSVRELEKIIEYCNDSLRVLCDSFKLKHKRLVCDKTFTGYIKLKTH